VKCEKAPRSHFDISATRTSKDKRVALFHYISKPRNAKCKKVPRSHFGISAIMTSKEKGVSLFHYIKKL
jgi:hypothetical protein